MSAIGSSLLLPLLFVVDSLDALIQNMTSPLVFLALSITKTAGQMGISVSLAQIAKDSDNVLFTECHYQGIAGTNSLHLAVFENPDNRA